MACADKNIIKLKIKKDLFNEVQIELGKVTLKSNF